MSPRLSTQYDYFLNLDFVLILLYFHDQIEHSIYTDVYPTLSDHFVVRSSNIKMIYLIEISHNQFIPTSFSENVRNPCSGSTLQTRRLNQPTSILISKIFYFPAGKSMKKSPQVCQENLCGKIRKHVGFQLFVENLFPICFQRKQTYLNLNLNFGLLFTAILSWHHSKIRRRRVLKWWTKQRIFSTLRE